MGGLTSPATDFLAKSVDVQQLQIELFVEVVNINDYCGVFSLETTADGLSGATNFLGIAVELVQLGHFVSFAFEHFPELHNVHQRLHGIVPNGVPHPQGGGGVSGGLGQQGIVRDELGTVKAQNTALGGRVSGQNGSGGSHEAHGGPGSEFLLKAFFWYHFWWVAGKHLIVRNGVGANAIAECDSVCVVGCVNGPNSARVKAILRLANASGHSRSNHKLAWNHGRQTEGQVSQLVDVSNFSLLKQPQDLSAFGQRSEFLVKKGLGASARLSHAPPDDAPLPPAHSSAFETRKGFAHHLLEIIGPQKQRPVNIGVKPLVINPFVRLGQL